MKNQLIATLTAFFIYAVGKVMHTEDLFIILVIAYCIRRDLERAGQ